MHTVTPRNKRMSANDLNHGTRPCRFIDLGDSSVRGNHFVHLMTRFVTCVDVAKAKQDYPDKLFVSQNPVTGFL